jgi:hypothetical protein
MKPSPLVTSGGARRHTAGGIKKISKAAFAGGAGAAIAIGLLVPGCGGHSKDWYYGHDVATDSAISLYNAGGGDVHNACTQAVKIEAMFAVRSVDVGEAVDGCLAGIEERKPRWA